MTVPCPCCKASNDAGPNCRRCKADLSLLFAVDAQRSAALDEARRFATATRFPESLAALDRAAQLRQGSDVSQLRAAVLLLSRDFAGALRAHQETA